MTQPVVVEFNEDIQLLNAQGIRIINHATGQAIPTGTISTHGRNLTLTPTLSYNSEYLVKLEAGSVSLASDNTLQIPATEWRFSTLPATPGTSSEARMFNPGEDLIIAFDRPIDLADGSAVTLINLETQQSVSLSALSTIGNNLIVVPHGLAGRERLMLEIGAGAVTSISDGQGNLRLRLPAYSGSFVVMPLNDFKNGAQGFLSAFTQGLLGAEVRRWSWNAGAAANDQGTHSGPGEDFSWFGTNRTYPTDFGATPALHLEAGEEYTLSFDYQTSNAELRVDLRTAAIRDEDQPSLAILPITNDAIGRPNLTVTAAANPAPTTLFFTAIPAGMHSPGCALTTLR
ncbi:MAG: Ig-like domain-containing protein [Verrucomicrobia bacterium]|nr:Ig-like domain-containing protein [Verrucomicrobiota bacterium]